MIKIILYTHYKLFKYKNMGKFEKKIEYNTVTIKKNKKEGEETHVFAG